MENKIVFYGGEIMSFQSEAVANKFVEIARAKEVEMTLMQLLKLVYFAHGWHLAVIDVLGPEKKIEVYRQPKDGQFTEHTRHGPGGTLTSAALPEFTLFLDDLFA